MSATSATTPAGLLIVDKPEGMTSHTVVSHIRKAFHTRKVGHAGTLDPLATGVLVLGIERGTRFLAHLVSSTKSYDTTIVLGRSTTTDDAEGDTQTLGDARNIHRAAIESAIEKLTGTIMQVPSSVSAIKIDGQRAYQRVRAGESVEIPARPVTIYSFIVRDIRPGTVPTEVLVDASITCSSGTYIRSLARDLGSLLGVGGHVARLRRTAVGSFSLTHARSLSDIEHEAESTQRAPHLTYTLDEALAKTFPTLLISNEEACALSHGKRLPGKGLLEHHTYAAITRDGRAFALIEEKHGYISTVFVARPAGLSGS